MQQMKLAVKSADVLDVETICVNYVMGMFQSKLVLIKRLDEAHEETCLPLAVSLNHMDIISSICAAPLWTAPRSRAFGTRPIKVTCFSQVRFSVKTPHTCHSAAGR